MKADDRRDFERIDTELPADATNERGLQIACITRNVSYRGLFLTTDQELEMGEDLDVSIWLTERGSGVGLRLAGEVIRQASDGVGIKIVSVPCSH